jgi:hypothetical protein
VRWRVWSSSFQVGGRTRRFMAVSVFWLTKSRPFTVVKGHRAAILSKLSGTFGKTKRLLPPHSSYPYYGQSIMERKMFGHPTLYFGEFERLSEQFKDPQHLISAVASIHRLTPQYATEAYHEWSKHGQRQPLTAAGE